MGFGMIVGINMSAVNFFCKKTFFFVRITNVMIVQDFKVMFAHFQVMEIFRSQLYIYGFRIRFRCSGP
jgi:hypothetical protein